LRNLSVVELLGTFEEGLGWMVEVRGADVMPRTAV